MRAAARLARESGASYSFARGIHGWTMVTELVTESLEMLRAGTDGQCATAQWLTSCCFARRSTRRRSSAGHARITAIGQ